MMMMHTEFRISISILYHDDDDDDDDDRTKLQRPTTTTICNRAPTQWLLPMVGIWNNYFDTTTANAATTTTNNNDNSNSNSNNNSSSRTNDVDTIHINTRYYHCYKHLQRGNDKSNCHDIRIRTTGTSITTTTGSSSSSSSSLRRKTIYRQKRLLVLPEHLYIILMILLVGSFNISIGFTIPNSHNNNINHYHHYHYRRYSQQISTRTIILDNVDDDTMMPIDNRNRNNVNDESTMSTNLHSNNVVSLLLLSPTTTTTTSMKNDNKNHRTKSIHSKIRMIHHALRQTSRVTTAAVLAACTTTTTTTDIPQIIVEETIPRPEEEHPLPSIPTTTQKSIIKTTIDSVQLRSQQQTQQRMKTNHNDYISLFQPPISSILPSTNVVFNLNTKNDILKTAAFSTTTDHHSSSRHQQLRMKPQMGIIINDDHATITANREKSSTGSTISLTSQTGISNRLHPDILIYEESIDPNKQQHTITKVRFATPHDDMDVAYLRMSVFADMNTNTVDLIRSQFCTRSCQAIASRRLRGAICFVATTTTTTTTKTTSTSTSVQPSQFAISQNNNINLDEVVNDPIEIVVGSIECSYHEFFHTRLGSCRKQHALLYITEVAVHTSVRRRGIGTKLLLAVDRYATQLRQQFNSDNDDDDDDDSNDNNIIESLYLHVDVSNVAAIRMYEQCGYYKVLSNDPMYTEFTTGLNLHPGATRGREHYLMCKNLVTNPIWLSSQQNIGSAMSQNEADRQQQQRRPILSRLGIEIPA